MNYPYCEPFIQSHNGGGGDNTPLIIRHKNCNPTYGCEIHIYENELYYIPLLKEAVFYNDIKGFKEIVHLETPYGGEHLRYVLMELMQDCLDDIGWLWLIYDEIKKILTHHVISGRRSYAYIEDALIQQCCDHAFPQNAHQLYKWFEEDAIKLNRNCHCHAYFEALCRNGFLTQVKNPNTFRHPITQSMYIDAFYTCIECSPPPRGGGSVIDYLVSKIHFNETIIEEAIYIITYSKSELSHQLIQYFKDLATRLKLTPNYSKSLQDAIIVNNIPVMELLENNGVMCSIRKKTT